MNPKLKAALYPLLAAILGALSTYFSMGCSPSQIAKVESAADRGFDAAECAKDVAKRYDDVLAAPEQLDLNELLALVKASRAELKACLKLAHPAPAGDAGVE
jgi:hypothetical protein